MLVRPDEDGALVIGQASHAWLSGQIARAWGNDRFPAPEPREEVCLAAEQHDIGMSEWDLSPKLDPESGWPQSFMQMALEDHLRLWSAAPEKLLSQSRYAALLVSMHGCALYERRDLGRMRAEQAAAVRAYLARERERQERLVELLRADPARVRVGRRLVFAWDGMSLALCLDWAEHAATHVPAAGGGGAEVRMKPVGGGRVAVDPWPFAATGAVAVSCEGRRLARPCRDEAELRDAVASAPAVRLGFDLVPQLC